MSTFWSVQTFVDHSNLVIEKDKKIAAWQSDVEKWKLEEATKEIITTSISNTQSEVKELIEWKYSSVDELKEHLMLIATLKKELNELKQRVLSIPKVWEYVDEWIQFSLTKVLWDIWVKIQNPNDLLHLDQLNYPSALSEIGSTTAFTKILSMEEEWALIQRSINTHNTHMDQLREEVKKDEYKSHDLKTYTEDSRHTSTVYFKTEWDETLYSTHQNTESVWTLKRWSDYFSKWLARFENWEAKFLTTMSFYKVIEVWNYFFMNKEDHGPFAIFDREGNILTPFMYHNVKIKKSQKHIVHVDTDYRTYVDFLERWVTNSNHSTQFYVDLSSDETVWNLLQNVPAWNATTGRLEKIEITRKLVHGEVTLETECVDVVHLWIVRKKLKGLGIATLKDAKKRKEEILGCSPTVISTMKNIFRDAKNLSWDE